MSRPPLEVQLEFGWRIGCGLALMGFFVLPLLASGLSGLASGATSRQLTMTFGIATGCFVVFGLVPLLLLVRRRGSVRRIDAQGVTRFDGRSFPWSEYKGLKRTLQRSRAGHTFLLSVELKFASGSATVWAATVKNFAEVSPVLDALEAGRNPWA